MPNKDHFRPYGHAFDPEEFPHGLRCMDCDKLFVDVSDRWTFRIVGMGMFADEPVASTEIICVECALMVAL